MADTIYFGGSDPKVNDYNYKYDYKYDINSQRDYDIDSRSYHKSTSSPFSQVTAPRQYGIDSRNYSQSQTDGNRIFSYRAGGGNATAKVFTNVVMWLMVFGIGFVLYKFLWPIIWKWIQLLKPTVGGTNENYTESILRHSKDKMSNGETYWGASVSLYREIWGTGILGWLKSTDHDSIGRILLSVSKAEYVQLNSVYYLYKGEVASFFQFGATSFDLTGDLKALFSASEKVKYLSHLGTI